MPMLKLHSSTQCILVGKPHRNALASYVGNPSAQSGLVEPCSRRFCALHLVFLPVVVLGDYLHGSCSANCSFNQAMQLHCILA